MFSTVFLRCLNNTTCRFVSAPIKTNNSNILLNISMKSFVLSNSYSSKNKLKYVPLVWSKDGATNNIRNVNTAALTSLKDPLLKKRSHKKRYAPDIDPENFEEGRYHVIAFTTASEYNLSELKKALIEQNLYNPQKVPDLDLTDVVITSENYRVGHEPRHMFFFREGTVVLWNCTELESNNVLSFLKQFEEDSYSEDLVLREKEIMSYKYQIPGKKCQLQASTYLLTPDSENILEKYTFSNAMAQSVKLGVWEASLNNYTDSIINLTNDLQRGVPISISRNEILRKTGTLYALRHNINLESDLLDTPDFYWERAELERLYIDTVGYFSISRRTRILNEKLSHCLELLELVASQQSDKHHVRLEWMIIVLIMVEVGFEMLHFGERYWNLFQS